MDDRHFIDNVLGSACLAFLILAFTSIVYAEDVSTLAGARESVIVLIAGIGLCGVCFIVRRHLRRRE